jgi:hypothetical protein
MSCLRLSTDSRGERTDKSRHGNLSVFPNISMKGYETIHSLWSASKHGRDNTLFTNNLHGPVTFLNKA